MLVMMLSIASFGGPITCAAQSKKGVKNYVEVIYFHGKQRCPTCMAIEKNAREVVSRTFANELKNGTVVFRVVDISTPKGEALADKYEVSWSSLYVNKWKGGKETRNNLTEFAFSCARKSPDRFKKGLTETIRKCLK